MNANEMTENLGQTANELQEQAGETARDIKQSAKDFTDKARRKVQTTAREVGAAADIYIHENTYTSMAIVAVAACLIGFLIGSRR